MASENKRFLGIGNATGLGMAPFLITHPELIHYWANTREIALQKVRSMQWAQGQVRQRFHELLQSSLSIERIFEHIFMHYELNVYVVR